MTLGNYTPSSEYPTVKQISLGPRLNLSDIKYYEPHKKFDFRQYVLLVKENLKYYKDTFEKYVNAAKDHNIDLFFCDALINDACLDAAQALKKPFVAFYSALNGKEFFLKMYGYIYYFYYYFFKF